MNDTKQCVFGWESKRSTTTILDDWCVFWYLLRAEKDPVKCDFYMFCLFFFFSIGRGLDEMELIHIMMWNACEPDHDMEYDEYDD